MCPASMLLETLLNKTALSLSVGPQMFLPGSNQHKFTLKILCTTQHPYTHAKISYATELEHLLGGL